MKRRLSVEERTNPRFGYPEAEDWTPLERLRREREALGFYLSSHPLDHYGPEVRQLASATAAGFLRLKDGDAVSLIGTIEDYEEKSTKAGARMAFFRVDDATGRVRSVAWPKTFAAISGALVPGAAVFLTGKVKVDLKRDENGLVLDDVPEEDLEHLFAVDTVEPLAKAIEARTRGATLRLRSDVTGEPLARLRASIVVIFGEHVGPVPVNVCIVRQGGAVEPLLIGGDRIEPSQRLVDAVTAAVAACSKSVERAPS